MKKYATSLAPDSTPNLIDLTSEVQNPLDASQDKKLDTYSAVNSKSSNETDQLREHEYVNCKDDKKNGKTFDFASSGSSNNLKDPFDMRK